PGPLAACGAFDVSGPVQPTDHAVRFHCAPTVPRHYRVGPIMDILLIRHGLPLRVESDRPVDPPLAPRGHEQAEALAAWLEPTPPDLLLSSTMNRAIDTAA